MALFSTLGVNGQTQVELSGVVKDSISGEAVIGAFITLSDSSHNYKTVASFDGSYKVKCAPGSYALKATAVGYAEFSTNIDLKQDTRLNLPMQLNMIITEKVVIQGESINQDVESTEIGVVEMNMDEIKKLPALMGEVDVLKSLQLLPGVQSGGEGNSGLYIRGGGPDQNLVLLDDAPIYNTGHLFGFFSVFNSDVIDGVTLYKGGIPSQYGGRLSSVIDFDVKQPDLKKWQTSGGIGLISSRLTVEGPLKKDTAGFLISGRRTYIDVLTKPLLDDPIPYYFHDLNAKAYWKLNENNRLYLNTYTGRDAVSFNFLDGRFIADILWGNNAGSLVWKHTYNDSLYHTITFHGNDYRFLSVSTFDLVDTEAFSKVSDLGLKSQWHWFPDSKHDIVGGFEVAHHKFTPRKFDAQTNDEQGINLVGESPNEEKFALEQAFFIHDEFDLTERLKINAGVRMSFFQQLGGYEEIFETEEGLDSISYGKGEVVRSFNGFEPRVFMRYSVNESSSIKAAVSRGKQYIHLLSLSGNNLPFDVWVPSSALVEPQTGIQYSAAYFKNFNEKELHTSVELYYRDMQNQIEFNEEYVPTLNGELERDLVFGDGYSYGAEFLIRKEVGDLNGWVGYTWSKTERVFPEINQGEAFPFKYDRRNDLSIVLTYDLNDRWSFGTSWVYGTGQAITLPEARYLIEGSIVTKYGDRNSYRMPDYHRLDLSATLNNTKWKRGESSWVFSVYNAYNRKNAYIIYVDASGDPAQGELEVIPRLVYIFPVLPSVTWNFKF